MAKTTPTMPQPERPSPMQSAELPFSWRHPFGKRVKAEDSPDPTMPQPERPSPMQSAESALSLRESLRRRIAGIRPR